MEPGWWSAARSDAGLRGRSQAPGQVRGRSSVARVPGVCFCRPDLVLIRSLFTATCVAPGARDGEAEWSKPLGSAARRRPGLQPRASVGADPVRRAHSELLAAAAAADRAGLPAAAPAAAVGAAAAAAGRLGP